MATMGRGRGRGRRMMSFSVEAVGINRGDALPPSILQPTPVFPVRGGAEREGGRGRVRERQADRHTQRDRDITILTVT